MRSFTLFSTLAVLASVVAADFSPAPIPKGANPVLPPTDVSLAKRDICILGICVGTSTSSSSAYQTDVNNCGSKGNKCTTNWLFGTGRQCVAGVCAPTSCNSLFDFNWLTGACQDVSSDTSNCGKCGQTCSTSTVSNSLSTKCVSGTCYAQSCATGYTLASGVCTKNIDTTSDTSNCGAVGTKCPTSYSNGSGSICSNSVCQPKSCSTGYAFDYSSKICRNILSDTSNCGSCGNVCQYAGGTGQCSNGVCSLKSCNSGYYNIGGTCTSLNLKTDAANCGTVGNDCNTKYANGVGSCSSGTCSLTGCQTGYELTTTYFLFWPTGSSCTAIDTTSDSDNCGAVGNSCPSSVANGGSASCKNSQCVASCNSGYTWDSTSLTCKNTATDCSNCGGVGKSCTVANGTPKCSSGVCSVDTCNTGYQLSNGACVAINTSTDTKNCGGLNIFCSSTYANGGVGICVLGKCITTCNVLYDWDSTLGFCRSVSSDVSNCGKCGSICSTSTVTGSKSVACTSGKCLATVCNDGYTLSNGVCTAVDYSSDVNNCGGKNNACSFLPSGATGACIKSVCTLQTCPTSYVLKSGVCVKSTASQAARLAKKDKVIESRSLCPAKETACPIRGSTTYDAAVSHHFSTQDEFSGVMLGQGGYECLDVSSSLESCGGCASTGEGRDCSAIRGAAGVGCDAGVCRILSCQGGYKVSLDGSKCVRVKSHAHGRNSTSSSAAKRHLAARHGSHGSL